jgi:hypothetical protein
MDAGDAVSRGRARAKEERLLVLFLFEERNKRKGDLHAIGIPSGRRDLEELEIPFLFSRP